MQDKVRASKSEIRKSKVLNLNDSKAKKNTLA